MRYVPSVWSLVVGACLSRTELPPFPHSSYSSGVSSEYNPPCFRSHRCRELPRPHLRGCGVPNVGCVGLTDGVNFAHVNTPTQPDAHWPTFVNFMYPEFGGFISRGRWWLFVCVFLLLWGDEVSCVCVCVWISVKLGLGVLLIYNIIVYILTFTHSNVPKCTVVIW